MRCHYPGTSQIIRGHSWSNWGKVEAISLVFGGVKVHPCAEFLLSNAISFAGNVALAYGFFYAPESSKDQEW
jgi:hypothetical protein